MPKLPEHPASPQQRVPVAPKPSAASGSEGMECAQKLARRFLPDAVILWSALAFAPSSEASPWVRVQCARLIAEVAGAIAQPVPEAPQPRGDGDAHA
jgi:hypothetical protein